MLQEDWREVNIRNFLNNQRVLNVTDCRTECLIWYLKQSSVMIMIMMMMVTIMMMMMMMAGSW